MDGAAEAAVRGESDKQLLLGLLGDFAVLANLSVLESETYISKDSLTWKSYLFL